MTFSLGITYSSSINLKTTDYLVFKIDVTKLGISLT